MIRRIATRPRRDAAFALEFIEGLTKSEESMGGRGESELTTRFETAPLFIEIKAEGSRGGFCSFQFVAAGEREGESWDSLNAFVRGGNEEMDLTGAKIDFHSAKTAHRVDNERAIECSGNFTEGFDGIENTGAGFAVDGGDVSEG